MLPWCLRKAMQAQEDVIESAKSAANTMKRSASLGHSVSFGRICFQPWFCFRILDFTKCFYILGSRRILSISINLGAKKAEKNNQEYTEEEWEAWTEAHARSVHSF